MLKKERFNAKYNTAMGQIPRSIERISSYRSKDPTNSIKIQSTEGDKFIEDFGGLNMALSHATASASELRLLLYHPHESLS